ncbi:MAG TPA: UbiX family flavin prenyltransferase [Bacteroidales bacterium]|nr:3-octaprenyl-4-hydroxybenzoate carboxy-lyase [Bacteroidales bacterium]HQG36543.1 UbiX family flavin prenyltransferase [Bacteroidales bacterium]HQG53033.1 UbiX family flavin prenyltransferase [Bacteroidales bacterium]HQJ20655.1 UbiX family flavin prenyltransferase [Bacteroidales bacterium]HRC89032.1 UbiX family flavin prenyltransferase [Bacteroidales bacterium]
MTKSARKIILAITGASGSIYALRLLEKIMAVESPPDEIAVILSDTAKEIWQYEIGMKPAFNIPAKEYENSSFQAPFASGSALYDTMIICPASMGTIGRIANGTSDNLIIRSADVILKERRKLILVPREAPYNLIHIRNMETLAMAGAIIFPASPSFYSKPQSIDDLIDNVVSRIIKLAEFDVPGFTWMGND